MVALRAGSGTSVSDDVVLPRDVAHEHRLLAIGEREEVVLQAAAGGLEGVAGLLTRLAHHR